MKRTNLLLAVLFCGETAFSATAAFDAKDFRIRDPFVLADAKTKAYYLCVVSSESASGRLEGPWINHYIIFDANGGHGMTFRAFDGSRKFTLHNPELWGSEHLAIYDFTDDGERIGIVEI